ncbi:putative RNA-directed DNA polymerase [Tanacetum coccineum]
MELHSLLQTAEQGIKKSDVPFTSAAPVLIVEYEIAPTSDPKEAVCFYCNTKGNWKRSCPKYLKDLKHEKVEKGVHSGTCERGKGLLDLVHIDVCGPFRLATKDRKHYYVMLTDDFNRYGYVYLIKHKSDTFEVFKRYKKEVENQLGRKIKVLRSDRGGEYLSIEFFNHLKNCGIVSQLTPPRTPQLNGVAERRNRTLLDMVRSMMCRATLLISFWGYALETVAHILNLVPTKKVLKTPFKMWKGKRPSLGHIKIWGCEVFVRRKAQDKLEARSEKLFLEREMISKKDSGSKIDIQEIQESADEEPIINTDTQQEVVTPVEPDDISLPIRRTSSRVSKPSQDPQFYYGFHIEEDKISDSTLTELNEPANYKEAMASPRATKWKEAMKSEIQSMYDNQVWNLADTTDRVLKYPRGTDVYQKGVGVC